MTIHDQISPHVLQFVKRPAAVALARSYGIDPNDATSTLWIRLSRQMNRNAEPIRDIGKWVRTNGYWMLKTYLRNEASHRLQQTTEAQT